MGLSNYPPGVTGNEPQITGESDEPEYIEYDWIREQTNATLVRKYGELCYKRGRGTLNEDEEDAMSDLEVELFTRDLLEES